MREALLRGPSATPSSPDAVLTARWFLRREPCGPRRHSWARARESETTSTRELAWKGPRQQRSARQQDTDGHRQANRPTLRPRTDPIQTREEREALCAQRHGRLAGSAPREPPRRGVRSRRMAWAAPAPPKTPHPPWGPRVPDGPRGPAPPWPLLCRPRPRPLERLVACAAQVLSERPSPTRTGFPLNTGRHRAGAPKTSSHPPQRLCPLPLLPLDAPPSPLSADSAAGTSSHHAAPPGGRPCSAGHLALPELTQTVLHKNMGNHSDLYRENPFISAFCSRLRVSPKCRRVVLLWLWAQRRLGVGGGRKGSCLCLARGGAGADPAVPPPSLAPVSPPPGQPFRSD